MLAALLDFDAQNPRSAQEWEIQHSSDHDEIRQAIQKSNSVNLSEWAIYPVNWQDWEAWALRHQQLHNDMNSVLGLIGVDLTQVDFKDQVARQFWNHQHFSEHQAARAALAI